MKEDGIESPWEDLGYTKEKPDKVLFRIPMCPIPNHQHESEFVTAARTMRNLDFICAVIVDPVVDFYGLVTGEVKGKKFDFWPSSDSYYVYSTGTFGVGIKELCDQIKRRLIDQAP